MLGAQQNDGQHQQRQRGRSGKLGFWRKLKQAPDLRRHGVEAGRQRQNRRRSEQSHRLQEGHQRARQQGRQNQWDGDPSRRVPAPAAQNRGCVLKLSRSSVERIRDQHKHVGKCVARDHENDARQRIDIEQMLVSAHPEPVTRELVREPAVGRSQKLPGDGAQKRRRHE